MRAQSTSKRSGRMSTSHGVTTVSNAPRRNGGRCTSASTRTSPARAGAGAESVRSTAASPRGAIGNSYSSSVSPRVDGVRDDQQQRIEIERYRERGRRSACADRRRAGRRRRRARARGPAARRAARRRAFERGVVLGVAPAPVAMDVRVIGRRDPDRRAGACAARGRSRSSPRAARSRAARAMHAAARHGRASRARGCRVARASPVAASRSRAQPRAQAVRARASASEKCRRPRHSPSAAFGSANSHGMPADRAESRRRSRRSAKRAGSGERCVAARAGEKVAECVGRRHRGRFVGLELIVAAIAGSKPVHRSRYVKAGGAKRTTVTRPSLAE